MLERSGEALGVLASVLRPRKKLGVREWSDRHRILTNVSSSEPGQWKTSRTPYLAEIMDVLTPGSGYRRCVLEKGAQVGGTEVANNRVGYGIDEDPGPILMVSPSESMARRNSKTRIAPMIEGVPRLRELLAMGSSNTVLEKYFLQAVLVLVGSNAPSQLRSMPCKLVILDEEDAYVLDVGGEGDVKELAEARLRTFPDGLLFEISTPTLLRTSRIHLAYEDSDQRKFVLPCPHCGHGQALEWGGIEWPDGHPELAAYRCAGCAVLIEERQKAWMLPRGKWVKGNPGHHVAGFHLNSLYSPLGWYSWVDAARMFLKTEESELVKKVFLNTVLGLPYEPDSDAPDWKELKQRPSDYLAGQVPDDVAVLTAGVDVQGDRLELEIVGWGETMQSWSIATLRLEGSTAEPEVWARLDVALKNRYVKANGAVIGIKKVAIDSGWNTQQVYRYVMQRPGQLIAIKGYSDQPNILGTPSDMEVTTTGGKMASGAKLWPVGVDVVKMELYGWLKTSEGNPGFCRWPMDYPDEYFKQLVAEHLVLTKNAKGYEQWVWEKTRKRNEALDCRVYARVAAVAMGLDRWNGDQWDRARLDGDHHVSQQRAKVGGIAGF